MLMGMAAVHASKVVHRDLKPGNVLIASDGQAQIADFGCAVAYDGDQEGYNNVDTETTGTPDYHSPELLLASTRNDYALDMWAAGAIIIEMMSLHKMIRAETAEERLILIFGIIGAACKEDRDAMLKRSAGDIAKQLGAGRPPANMQEVCPGASPCLLDLVKSLLMFNPKKRASAVGALAHPFYQDMRVEGASQTVSLVEEGDEGTFTFVPPRSHNLQSIWAEIQDQATLSPSKPVV